MSTHLDTHVAIWLAAGEKRRLKSARRRLRQDAVFVSPIVALELQLLFEIGRLRHSATVVLGLLSEAHGITQAPGELLELADRARALSWTRDPFDRLIVAHAIARQATLLTADQVILAHCEQARWDD